MMKNSFEMALEVINKEGGIKGRPLKLVYANDQGKRKPGEKAVTVLVAKTGAVMLVGAYQSSNTIYMARIADKLDRPFLVCNRCRRPNHATEMEKRLSAESACPRIYKRVGRFFSEKDQTKIHGNHIRKQSGMGPAVP